ncbi:MAG TPA: S-methyl-5-thioribose-1-phosphate isomerase, partial [Gemmatimonadales bacterium]|nr:S-methyl-5-thioribose-1-phosphate isomerase [Gemmatimonadales bacterium]
MRMQAFAWAPSGRLSLLDQTLLPLAERWIEVGSVDEIVEAIRALRVRGAPAIGITAAMGLVAAMRFVTAGPRSMFLALIERGAEAIRAARPTAVNLGWAMDRMVRRARGTPGDARAILAALEAEAQAIWDEDRSACEKIAEHGQVLVASSADAKLRRAGHGREPGAPVNILTHCNTGFLATGGIGTALGIVHLAAERGAQLHVWVDETRPLLQGSRLTAWELLRAGIPHTVIPDGAAASLLARGQVDVVLVGADRVARNGDVANKLGTYPLAIAAKRHGVPFYSAAPFSSFDPECPSGDAIVIEERSAAELTAP